MPSTDDVRVSGESVSTHEEATPSWDESIEALVHPRVMTMLFLGFSAGVPILLIFSSLSLWLREAGVEKSAVTFFSWAALGYSFKFVWAPLVDRLPVPLLTSWLGRRRGWMLLSQLAVIASIIWMGMTDPSVGASSLTVMAFAAVALGFSSATQDIVIDAYRIESASAELQGLMSSTYIAGYRIGMIVAGAGALYLASGFGSDVDVYHYEAWQYTYLIMGMVMLVGVLTTLIIPEPESQRENLDSHGTGDHLRFLITFLVSVLAFIFFFYFSSSTTDGAKASLTAIFSIGALGGLLVESIRLCLALAVALAVARVLMRAGVVDGAMLDAAYLDPVRDFFSRYGIGLAVLLLAVVGFYRVSDIVLGVIANVFYQDIGYTKIEIANASKVFGLLATIVGGFAGGLLAVHFGVMRILFLGAVLSALTNLLFIVLANSGPDLLLLYLVIAADNLSAGLSMAAFVAFVSSLTNISFTAVQYAIFSSLMTLFPKVFGGYSGSIVESVGYSTFFTITALLTLPVLILIVVAGKRFEMKVP